MMMLEKVCGRCKESRSVAEFNRNRSERDGLQRFCKRCQVLANRDWAERRSEVRAEARRRYEARNPSRRRGVGPQQKYCHHQVARAIASGALVRPEECSACHKADGVIQAHHGDYTRPLDVTWLCARCHGRLHAVEKVAA